MLSSVQKAMLEAGAIQPHASLDFNVTVSTGDTISMDVCESGRTWCHIKLSRYSDLSAQFEKYCLARQRFSSFAPEPIGHRKVGDWSILMCRSIEHQGVQVADLRGDFHIGKHTNELIYFFLAAKNQGSMACDKAGHQELLNDLLQFFSEAEKTGSQVLRWLLQSSQADWLTLPYIPQHGDFVLNNLGSADGHLVVFDWEDYGTTGLAGFDICMLCLSLGGMNAHTARAIQSTEHPAGTPWSFAWHACSASGVPYQLFRSAVPIYLIVFRYLKRNYSSTICQRIDDILNQILS